MHSPMEPRDLHASREPRRLSAHFLAVDGPHDALCTQHMFGRCTYLSKPQAENAAQALGLARTGQGKCMNVRRWGKY